LDTFIARISTVAAIALCLQKWRTHEYHPILYTVLGPNCCKVATKVCLGIPRGLVFQRAVSKSLLRRFVATFNECSQ
jgi:hypothetical protein